MIELIGDQIARTPQVLVTGPNALQTLTGELQGRGESDLAPAHQSEIQSQPNGRRPLCEAGCDEMMHAEMQHVAERHRIAGWVLGLHLVIRVWFAYRRWFLLIILNLSSAIAVRAVLAITYPATAITMWTNLHC